MNTRNYIFAVILVVAVASFALAATIEVRNEGASVASRTTTVQRPAHQETNVTVERRNEGGASASSTAYLRGQKVTVLPIEESNIASSAARTGQLMFFWDVDGSAPCLALMYKDATGTIYIASFPANFSADTR